MNFNYLSNILTEVNLMKVIVINGPMGVGKTTVGKYIAENNVGTAFIDGDWCMDIHPFGGNKETKAMAVDNILHLITNYQKCSVCQMIVLVWLMDSEWVYEAVADGIKAMNLDVNSVTLMCDEQELINRWKNDDKCPWRTDEWLDISVKSLPYFAELNNCIDTTGLSVSDIAQIIMNQNK